MASVNSCGIYLLKGGIRKTDTGNYLTGSVMKISCESGYMLFGFDEFKCNWNGTWLPTNNKWLEKFRDWPYCEREWFVSFNLTKTASLIKSRYIWIDYHITAIRWTAIGISSLLSLGIAIATVYFFFCSEQKEYVMRNQKQDEFFDFVEPETDGEIEAFKDLAEKNYRKDGFETNFPSTPNLLNLVIDPETGSRKYNVDGADEEDEEMDQELDQSELMPVNNLEKPYIILQVPKK